MSIDKITELFEKYDVFDIRILTALLIITISNFIINWWFSYTKTKGENAARKEDIKDITERIESVRSEYNKSLEEVKSKLQHNMTIVNKRVEIYSGIKDKLNSIYSYIKRVGNWKGMNPETILKYKREVDLEIYSTKPLWSKEFMSMYHEFMNICFVTERGHGKNAGIIAETEKYENHEEYTDYYDGCFDEKKLDTAHNNLMSALSDDFGV